MESKEIFKKCGCTEDKEYKGLWYHKDLPFEMWEHGGNLKLQINMEYTIDKDKIPLTEESLKRLIKAFNPNK